MQCRVFNGKKAGPVVRGPKEVFQVSTPLPSAAKRISQSPKQADPPRPGAAHSHAVKGGQEGRKLA